MNWITNAVLPKIKALVSTNDVPENLWIKCKSCGQMIFHREFEQAYNCCSTCGHHDPLPPESRFAMTFDDGKFDSISLNAVNDDPLKFRDSRKYADRLKDTRAKTGVNDAIASSAAGMLEKGGGEEPLALGVEDGLNGVGHASRHHGFEPRFVGVTAKDVGSAGDEGSLTIRSRVGLLGKGPFGPVNPAVFAQIGTVKVVGAAC